MGLHQNIVLWLGSVAALGLLWVIIGKKLLSFEARERRRRQRNYGGLVSRRPARPVNFAARMS